MTIKVLQFGVLSSYDDGHRDNDHDDDDHNNDDDQDDDENVYDNDALNHISQVSVRRSLHSIRRTPRKLTWPKVEIQIDPNHQM